MHSDLNRFVKKTSRSLDILYDKRAVVAAVTNEVAEMVPAFKGQVEKEYVSLPAGSKNLFSLAALYDANEELLREAKSDDHRTRNELTSIAVEFCNIVSRYIPEWMRVKNGHVLSRELRQESICAHSLVLRPLGAAGAELMQRDPTGWKTRLQALPEVDWSKRNPDWENVNMVANSVVSNRQARLATKAYLKQKLGLELTEAELRSITPPAPVDAV